MKEHQFIYHNGAQAKFKMEVLQVFKDTLSRQISEAVRIEHTIRDGFFVSNEKSEWHSASLVSFASEVQTDVRRNPGGWKYRCNNLQIFSLLNPKGLSKLSEIEELFMLWGSLSF